MKEVPNKDALEVQALAYFKEEWAGLGLATVIPTGGEIMPRRFYAAVFTAVVMRLVKEYEQPDAQNVLYGTLQTVLGNASQLGAKLEKDKFFSRATAAATADDLLAKLKARQAQG